MRWLRRVSLVACGALLVGCLAEVPAAMATTSTAAAAAAPASTAQTTATSGQSAAKAAPGPSRLSDPSKVLPSGWQRSSDEAVTVSGDATGLHVLAASESSGYAWRTVATLGDPAVQTDLWVGQGCVTAGARYAVVVYAPEQAANMAEEQGVLGDAAIVNLRTGAVKDLGGGFSIAYFDPGCGTGSDAVLTKGGWANDDSDGPMSTTLVVADVATGKVSAPVKVAGQVTSAVPFDGQIAAAGGRGVEQVSLAGRTRLLEATAAVPFRLTPAADGSLGYQVMAGKNVSLWQLAGGRSTRVGSAAAGSVELRQIGGKTWLVGPQASKVAGLPRSWQPVDAPAIAQPSSTGTLAVTNAEAVTPVKGQHYNPASAQPVNVSAQLLAGERGSDSFKVATAAAPVPAPPGGTAKAATGTATAATTALVRPDATTPGSPSTPISADRTCAVALDDPTIQAYQPTFQQVEWAADQAVQGTLTDTRPANLYGSGLPSYSPQGLFPLPAVLGGGHLPAQVLLGVLTQESNLQQASMHVIQGQTANPLSSFNWYGNWTNGETDNTGLIDWANSDCGYGIGQITSGMCMAGNPNQNNECAGQESTTMTAEQQLAVAVDYQANIAAAAQLLVVEWDDLYELGITPTDVIPPAEGLFDPDPSDYIGMWYMAIWAYNSGLEPASPDLGNTSGCNPGSIPAGSCTDGMENWGLGYADNPINPAYPPDRPNFPSASSNATPTGTVYSPDWDMSHPQYWPYQEKVNGWAFDSITLWDYSKGEDVQAFAYAPGNSAVATFDTFCVPGAGSVTTTGTPGDNCNSGSVDYTKPTAPDSCQLPNPGSYADHCWWHWPAQVNATTTNHGETPGCLLATDCGLQVITYAAGAADPGPEPIAAQFAQTCASTLPSTAVIVGDGGQSALGCPGQNWTSQGSFTWNFAPDQKGYYSSKIDFDQIGAGFGGHFWFGYSQPTATPTDTVITGTWNPPSSVSGWTDVKVAIPSYGANAADAVYTVDPGGGTSGKSVQIDQGDTSGTNAWVDLGDFDLSNGATVSLSNVTPDYSGSTVTSQDLAWSAAAFIPTSGPSWDYTAMGDSYSSGEGNPPYDPNNDGCDRSNAAFGRQFAADTPGIGSAGIQHIACSGATIANLTTTGQNGEEPQIDQMTSGSKLVTVTIGGNDAGFASVLTDCVTTLTTCESDYNGANSSNEYTVIDGLKSQLVDAYDEIKAKAPSAAVVAVTYPNIFAPMTTCADINNMQVSDVQFLINLTMYLDNTIIAAAKQAGINVLDERYAFLGHELCSSDPWVYSLPVPYPSGTKVLDGDAWFHPTAVGQAQIASDLGNYWTALQAGSAPTIWPVSVPAPATGWLPANLPYGIPDTEQAQAMLNSLANITAYAGDYNSSASYWNFRTRNGCDTRNLVLRAEALTTMQWPSAAALNPPAGASSLCPVTAGAWQTPYEASTTPLNYNYSTQAQIGSGTAGPPPGLAIDHIVPKGDAWETGAADWQVNYGDAEGTQMLTDFANDLGGPELLTVSSVSNSSKGDSPPEVWMPANTGMTCAYAKMWIAVKWEWSLEVGTIDDGINGNEPTERIFLQDTLNGC